MTRRQATIWFSASVLAVSWVVCAVLLSLLLGEVGFQGVLLGGAITPVILGFGWFKAAHGSFLEFRDPTCVASFLMGGISLGMGLVLLFLRPSLQPAGVLGFIVAGVLGLDLGIALTLRDAS